ncbi:acylneuraminate cytidylyltransferase family protein [Cognataquiflexum aquatile]|uniref:acylneuraminate cytidylyltransferase family protein n=1 Tax=Cognataquiflexum aquatile TaxID=2249427 RepID=UPI000DEA8A95|nr:acylneuraminate cytidylyltransferase family protein [Cognataquiflexum aquatile]
MKILVTICARGGSKGIPGKNILPLNNKPLLHYTLETAFAFCEKYGADLQISTDSQEILDCAGLKGYRTAYKRPEELATDQAGKMDSIRQAWVFAESNFGKNYDYVLDLDVTSPLRNLRDLESALEILINFPNALNIFSVNKASRNPYFNMVEESGDGFVKVVKDFGELKSRQEAPIVYDMNASFYIFTREYMKGNFFISTTERSLAYVMPHICFDIDEPIDFKIMELLMKDGSLGFKL